MVEGAWLVVGEGRARAVAQVGEVDRARFAFCPDLSILIATSAQTDRLITARDTG
jgi:hypothetical protein